MKKIAIIVLGNDEEIKMELFQNEAPGTVANFEKLANSNFYDGLVFHRVIKGFVAQGGDPTGTGSGGPGYTIKCETKNNPHKHQKGAISMAHAGKDTGGSQFFLCQDAFPHLDGVHTVFGQTYSGIDYIMKLQQGDIMKSIRVYDSEDLM